MTRVNRASIGLKSRPATGDCRRSGGALTTITKAGTQPWFIDGWWIGVPGRGEKMIIGIKSRLLAVSLSGAAAAPAWAYGGGYHYGSGMMLGGGVFGWMTMILVIVLAVAIGIGVARWLFTGGHHRPSVSAAPGRSALEILEERYARGEIDKDEFEEKRKTLSG